MKLKKKPKIKAMQCSMIKSNKKLTKKIIYEIHDYDKKKININFFFCSSERGTLNSLLNSLYLVLFNVRGL
jgi:hypothetical protein